jgi:3-methyladenine DNA glycosylase AlkD
MANNYQHIQKSLRQYATLERKSKIEWFFKTGKGQYGEGDKFIGVTNPDVRRVARQYQDIALSELELLTRSPIHEDRLCALIILVNQNKKSNLETRQKIVKLFLNNLEFINNWDLVDCSAHYILGRAIAEGVENIKILDNLANSKILWERRIAIISTMYFISQNNITESLRIAKVFLSDKEDLIHKAVGWTLREAWKRKAQEVEKFLKDNYLQLPRTTLRYTIERMEESKRKMFLKGVF